MSLHSHANRQLNTVIQLELVNNTNSNHEDDSVITLADTCNNFGKYIASNYALFRMLVENDLTKVIYMKIIQSMSSCNKSLTNIDDELRGYAIQFTAAGLSSLTQKYVQEHKKPDQNELARLAYNIMSGNIYKP